MLYETNGMRQDVLQNGPLMWHVRQEQKFAALILLDYMAESKLHIAMASR